jgi:hypothetical protein
LGISAIQQLAKENNELKTKTEKTEAESKKQQAINQSLQQQIDELKKAILKNK